MPRLAGRPELVYGLRSSSGGFDHVVVFSTTRQSYRPCLNRKPFCASSCKQVVSARSHIIANPKVPDKNVSAALIREPINTQPLRSLQPEFSPFILSLLTRKRVLRDASMLLKVPA
jgi:hypothetical protein